MDLGLKNKKALVTGASRGLGFATASALSGEGAHVAVNARDAGRLQQAAAEIERKTGNKTVALPGDLVLAGIRLFPPGPCRGETRGIGYPGGQFRRAAAGEV